MSAAELLMMFHFYFMGNREGLVFDVCESPMSQAFWDPLGQRIEGHNGTVETAVSVDRVEPKNGRWRVSHGEQEQDFDALVLALSVPGIQGLVKRSPLLGTPSWRHKIAQLDVTLPFAVWRCWLDRAAAPHRTAFVGTTGVGILDNISLYERFQDESRGWSQANGNKSVIELHAYAIDPGLTQKAIRAQLWRGCCEIYPELRAARIADDVFLLRRDCPSFAPNSFAQRPTVNSLASNAAIAGGFRAPAHAIRSDGARGNLGRRSGQSRLGATKNHGPNPCNPLPRAGFWRFPGCGDVPDIHRRRGVAHDSVDHTGAHPALSKTLP